MKIGNLVRDKENVDCTGVVVEVDKPEGICKVVWTDGGIEWLTGMFLEYISEN
tara:strand:+ start:29231 stop:29389 length:159 start_codon:yes stop_codon:yes gene_type:complete